MSNVQLKAPVLETDRLILRAPQMTDFDPFLSFMQQDRSKFVRGVEIDNVLGWRAFAHVTGMWVLRGYGTFIIEERASGKPLGMAGPWHPIYWPEREIGWSLWAEADEGKGIAFEAASATLNYAFSELKWDTAVSYIHPDNSRSRELAERLNAVVDKNAELPDEEPAIVYRHARS